MPQGFFIELTLILYTNHITQAIKVQKERAASIVGDQSGNFLGKQKTSNITEPGFSNCLPL
jgi:hypothetical protein